jgi:hypothetical protein
LVIAAVSFVTASHLPVGKFSPFLGFPIGAFLSVFILDFLLRLPAAGIHLGRLIGHVTRTHRFAGYLAPKWKTRLPSKVQIMLVFIRLAVKAAILTLLIFATGAWLSSLAVSVGEFPKTAFRALILATVWGHSHLL